MVLSRARKVWGEKLGSKMSALRNKLQPNDRIIYFRPINLHIYVANGFQSDSSIADITNKIQMSTVLTFDSP